MNSCGWLEERLGWGAGGEVGVGGWRRGWGGGLKPWAILSRSTRCSSSSSMSEGQVNMIMPIKTSNLTSPQCYNTQRGTKQCCTAHYKIHAQSCNNDPPTNTLASLLPPRTIETPEHTRYNLVIFFTHSTHLKSFSEMSSSIPPTYREVMVRSSGADNCGSSDAIFISLSATGSSLP